MLTRKARYSAALLLSSVSILLGQDVATSPDAGSDAIHPRRSPFGPPAFLLKDALDTDKDGKLSAAEIQAAPEALKKLDADNDGKLNAEETGWPPRRPGFPSGPGGPGGPFGGPPPGTGERGNPDFVARFMSRDADGDGKVTKQELPKSMRFLVARADANKDGGVDQSEAARWAQQVGLAEIESDARTHAKTETPDR